MAPAPNLSLAADRDANTDDESLLRSMEGLKLAAGGVQTKTLIEPFRIKTVEPIRISTLEERRAILKEANYNLFRVPAESVIVDLLTDSGTGAMSSAQWAGIMQGDESYAGAKSWFRLNEAVKKVTGFDNVLPTHQGRASERILFQLLLGGQEEGGKRNFVVPNNAHFDTTRANIEYHGAEARNLLTAEGSDPDMEAPFKGNMDVSALEELLRTRAGDVPVVMVTVTCNSNGGQPVSLANLKEVRKVCDEYKKSLFLDACRFAENAWFIKTREQGQGDRSAAEIAREMFDLADGATISAKKDGLVNIGGLLLIRDADMFAKAGSLGILTEGYLTYGGLAGRDLEAMAVGFSEVLEEDYLRYRIRSTAYLGERLIEAGVPIVRPPGGHAIYIDAGKLLPHIPSRQFPGQALACALYEFGGIRGCEIGSVMFGTDDSAVDETGDPKENLVPPSQRHVEDKSARTVAMELVRLAIPRRMYTQSHIDYVAEVVAAVAKVGRQLRGMKMVYAPKELRHFSAHFKPAV